MGRQKETLTFITYDHLIASKAESITLWRKTREWLRELLSYFFHIFVKSQGRFSFREINY